MSKKRGSVTVISARAPAKINLGLRVLRKRPDGYHDLLSLMVPVSLCDELRLERGSQHIELNCPNSELPTNDENLVYRAARSVLSRCRQAHGVRIELTKNIPVGAGLGGGSSDAATTLVMVNELLGRPLKCEDLFALGLQLGADVPFFLLGRWAIAEGVGERLTSLKNVPLLWTVLVHPHFQVSTRWAYENLTLTSGPNGSRFNFSEDTSAGEMATSHQRLLDRQRLTIEDILPLLVNDFEPLVFGHYPQLHGLRKALLAAGAKAAPMTGSGATLVGLFGSMREAQAAHEELCRRDDVTSFMAHTLDTTSAVVFERNL
jgi:4-diphosphocytidyl-2-C-methyl-D-erythritol kinase